jgi:hypothetical protein
MKNVAECKNNTERLPRFFTSHAISDVSASISQQVEVEDEYKTKEHLSLWISLDEIENHFNRSISCFFLFVKYVLIGLSINSVFAIVVTALRIYFLWQSPDEPSEQITIWYWISVSMQSSRLRYYMYVFSPLSTCVGFAVPFAYNWKLRRMKESKDINSARFDLRSFKHRNVTSEMHGGGSSNQRRAPVEIVRTHKTRTQTRLYPSGYELEMKHNVHEPHVQNVTEDAYSADSVQLDVLPSIAPPVTQNAAKMLNTAHRVHHVKIYRKTHQVGQVDSPTDAIDLAEPTSCCERIRAHLSSVYAYDRARLVHIIKPLLSYAVSFVVGAGFLVAQVFSNTQLLRYTSIVGDLLLTFLLSCISMILYTCWTYTAEWLTYHMEHHDNSDGSYQSYFIKVFVYRLGSTLILFFVTHTFYQDHTSASILCPYTSLTQQYVSELISQIAFAIIKIGALHVYRTIVVRVFNKQEYSDLEWVPTFVLEEEIINLLYLLFLYLYGLHVFPLLSLCSLATIGALSITIRYRLFKICKPVDKGVQKSFRKSLMLANSLNVIAAFWFGFLNVVLGYSSEITNACTTT